MFNRCMFLCILLQNCLYSYIFSVNIYTWSFLFCPVCRYLQSHMCSVVWGLTNLPPKCLLLSYVLFVCFLPVILLFTLTPTSWGRCLPSLSLVRPKVLFEGYLFICWVSLWNNIVRSWTSNVKSLKMTETELNVLFLYAGLLFHA